MEMDQRAVTVKRMSTTAWWLTSGGGPEGTEGKECQRPHGGCLVALHMKRGNVKKRCVKCSKRGIFCIKFALFDSVVFVTNWG